MLTKNSVIAIVGPTSSGKTRNAVKLALEVPNFSDFNSAEIICCDSRQIYFDMNVATAKPGIEEISAVRHHLYDFMPPDVSDYSVAVFVEQAQRKIKELLDKNILPIVVGGTGLYFKSLLGNFDIPKVAPNYELRDELNKQSNETLYAVLIEKDPILAEKIHPNNKNKIIRALEVMETLKIPMSEAQKRKESPWEVVWVGVDAKNREFLYQRINERCDKMLQAELLEELKSNVEKYGKLGLFYATIGYKEFFPYLDSQIPYEEAVEKFKQHTRNYAKRQLSWFRADKNINWFYIDEMSEEQIIAGIIKLCL